MTSDIDVRTTSLQNGRMDETTRKLEDLTRWLGTQREVALFLGKQQRQIWSWLKGEHELREANRVAVADAWERVRRVVEQVGDDPTAIALVFRGPARARDARRVLRALPPQNHAVLTEDDDADVASDQMAEGYFVPIEDYGARHAAGALARTRPLFVVH